MYVAGVDSSTQSCKVVICDAATGQIIRQGRAAHPPGTEVDPEAWWQALQTAITAAGGIADVAALSIAGQQHGLVTLDDTGKVIRPALLWNDTRSAPQAQELIREAGHGDLRRGAANWADRCGVVPVASITVSKVRWLLENEPENARRTSAICLPHDWLMWRLLTEKASSSLAHLATDRSEASGTGYFSAASNTYLNDILCDALGHLPQVPRVCEPFEIAGYSAAGIPIAPGAGDNAAAAFGLGAELGDVIISVGTSGTISVVSSEQSQDPSGEIAGFADATGAYLPLICTQNAGQVFDGVSRLLGVDAAAFDQLALSDKTGSSGLCFVPFLSGERTPNLPHATGILEGITLENLAPQAFARAAVEGVACSLAYGLEVLQNYGIELGRIVVTGGATRLQSVQQILAAVTARPLFLPEPAEYVALGAARQAAAIALGAPPQWTASGTTITAKPTPDVFARYREAVTRLVENSP